MEGTRRRLETKCYSAKTRFFNKKNLSPKTPPAIDLPDGTSGLMPQGCVWSCAAFGENQRQLVGNQGWLPGNGR